MLTLVLLLLLLDTTAFYTHTVYSDVCVVCVRAALAHIPDLYRGIVNTMSFGFGSVTHRREGGGEGRKTRLTPFVSSAVVRADSCGGRRRGRKYNIPGAVPDFSFRISLRRVPWLSLPPRHYIHYIIDFIYVSRGGVCVCVYGYSSSSAFSGKKRRPAKKSKRKPHHSHVIPFFRHISMLPS